MGWNQAGRKYSIGGIHCTCFRHSPLQKIFTLGIISVKDVVEEKVFDALELPRILLAKEVMK
jgi:hypothetical protein